MAYRFEQLPYIGFNRQARAAKKAFDMRAGHYPLTIRVTNGDRVLMQMEWLNVWDRKAKPDVLTDKDWTVPINFEIWEHEMLWTSVELEDVAVPTHFSIQQDFTGFFSG
jgi:hypothetical protein